jgi:hypothetical protein
MASGHQAVLQGRGSSQLMNQKQTTDEQQDDDRNTHKASGLPLGDLVLGILIQPMVMAIHRILPLGRVSSKSLGGDMKGRQEVATFGMFG